MQAHPEWDVLNRGVNGERADQIRLRFERDALRHSPQVVIIIAGVNDIYQGRSPRDVIDQLQAMYQAASTSGVRVVAGSILPFNTATDDENRRMHEVNEWIRRFAERDSTVDFVDTRAAVCAPDAPNRLVSSPDELHPSVDGYRLMAETLLPTLERLVGDRHLFRD